MTMNKWGIGITDLRTAEWGKWGKRAAPYVCPGHLIKGATVASYLYIVQLYWHPV